jgi:putative DNA primase/helicase
MLGSRAGLLGLAQIQQNRFALSELPGKTLVTSFEQPSGKMETNILNTLISGEPLTVERKFRESIDFTPKAKVLWAMNERPKPKSVNDGLFRRLAVIPFSEIPEDKRDKSYKEAVKTEGSGILNWALEGLDRLNKRGRFLIPQTVQDATANYRNAIDIPAKFVMGMCVQGPDYNEQSSILYNAYKKWCDENGHKPLSITAIAEDWKRLGFESYPSNGRNRWRGVQLK